MKIAIVGAGWYGCHLALKLKELGHEVTIFEKNSDIFSGISGSFGIRLHSGTHYPRSADTRKNCREGFKAFIEEYPELVVEHESSIYGLGEKDSTGKPSHVDEATFAKVCREFDAVEEVSPEKQGYQNLLSAFDFKEPSIKLGVPLREYFKDKLEKAGVKIECETSVTQIESDGDKVKLKAIKGGDSTELVFDKGINTTSYQTLLPDSHPAFPFEVTYQPCLGLIYKAKNPSDKPFSFIVMDGLFPCVMPLLDGDKDKYLLTHGEFTILASCKTVAEAEECLKKIDNNYIDKITKPNCEREISKFLQTFLSQYEYQGWKGSVLAKLKTASEFRSAVTFAKDNIIYVIPGKVSNIFDVENEVKNILLQNHILTDEQGFSYIRDGVLDHSKQEIASLPSDARATTLLQTFFHTRNPKEEIPELESDKQAHPEEIYKLRS